MFNNSRWTGSIENPRGSYLLLMVLTSWLFLSKTFLTSWNLAFNSWSAARVLSMLALKFVMWVCRDCIWKNNEEWNILGHRPRALKWPFIEKIVLWHRSYFNEYKCWFDEFVDYVIFHRIYFIEWQFHVPKTTTSNTLWRYSKGVHFDEICHRNISSKVLNGS